MEESKKISVIPPVPSRPSESVSGKLLDRLSFKLLLVFLTVAFIPFIAVTFTIIYGYENLLALIFGDFAHQGVTIPPEIMQRLLGVRVQFGIIVLMLSAAMAIGSFVLGSIFAAPAANLLSLMRRIARGDMEVHFPRKATTRWRSSGARSRPP